MATNEHRGRLWRPTWVVLILNGILLALGCGPANLAMFIAPFMDNNLPPDYKLVTSSKEVTVAVMATFSQQEDRRELLTADSELAEQVALHLQLRAKANKEKVKIVPVSQVRNYLERPGKRNTVSPLDVGKHFKADYVLELEVNSLSLYKKLSHNQFYLGNAELEVSLYDMHKDEGEHKVYNKPYRCEYPGSGPRDVGDCSQSQFRSLFLTKLAREISKLFIAYPPDERTEME